MSNHKKRSPKSAKSTSGITPISTELPEPIRSNAPRELLAPTSITLRNFIPKMWHWGLNSLLALICQNPRYLTVARLCMKLGAHPNVPMREGQSALHLAVTANNIDFVRECIRQKQHKTIYFNEPNANGDILATLALRHNPSRAIFNLLLAEGYNVVARTLENVIFNAITSTENARTPLHTAVLVSDLAEVNRLLAQNTAENLMDSASCLSTLHAAAMLGNTQVLTALLNQSCMRQDINLVITDERRAGMTPLWIAAAYGHVDAVRLLVENGANVNLLGARGKTPITIAHEQRHHDVVAYLQSQGAKLPRTPTPVRKDQQNNKSTLYTPIAHARRIRKTVETVEKPQNNRKLKLQKKS